MKLGLVFAMLARDLRSRLRDRSALILALVAPAALIGILSALVEGPDTDDISLGVVSDSSTLATALEQGALTSLTEDGTLAVKEYADLAALRKAVRADKVAAGIAVDDGALTVVRNPDETIDSAIAEALARSTARSMDGVGQAAAAIQALGVTPDPQALATALRTSGSNVSEAEGTEGIDQKTQIASGMATFFLFFTVGFGVLGLLQERRQGTLPRLLAAPVRPWQIVLSKVLVSFVLGLASMIVLIGFSTWVLGAQWGDPLGVAILTVCGVTAAVGTVSLVAGLVRNPDQANAAQSMIALVLGLLGGSFFSMARAGGIAAVASKLTPHYWYGEGLVRLTGGRDWTAALEPAGYLLLFAAVVGVPGLILAGKAVRS